MSTIENNKLIAEFMGFKTCITRSQEGKKYDYNLPNGFELIKEVETTIESNWCEVLEEQDYCFIEDLKFHTSWDWLMPVVHKIVADYEFNEQEELSDNEYRESLMDIVPFGIISDVYESVVEFIKWYNNTQQ